MLQSLSEPTYFSARISRIKIAFDFEKTMFSIAGICASALSIAAAIASRKGGSILTGAALGLIGGFAFSTPLGFIGGKIASSLTKKDSVFEIESNNTVATENE